MTTYVGQVDVEVVPAGPGAIKVYESEVIDSEWEAADARMLIGDIADHERHSVAELTIQASPHTDGTFPASVSIELTPEDIDEVIAALTAIRSAARAGRFWGGKK